MIKSKFQVGDLVRASRKIEKEKGIYTRKWTRENRPVDRVRITDELKKTLRYDDIGIITFKLKMEPYDFYQYEVKFMKTGITIILPEEQLKCAR